MKEGMPRRIISPEKDAEIVARLLVTRNATLAVQSEGVSFSKAWRIADRESIELTARREARGDWRHSPERRSAVIEARRANPNRTQQEIADVAGVGRSAVRRIECNSPSHRSGQSASVAAVASLDPANVL